MPYSQIVDGKVLDYHFKRLQVFENGSNHYLFSIGDIPIGQVFRMGKGNWTAVSRHPNPLGCIDGLRSRLDCCTILLKLAGYNLR